MRWIFYTLLAVNIGLLGYGLWSKNILSQYIPSLAFSDQLGPHGDSSNNLLLNDEASIPPLVLLSELKEAGQPDQPLVDVRLVTSSDSSEEEFFYGDVPPATSLSRSLCTLVGSFNQREKADTFVDQLRSYGVRSKVKNLLVSSTVGFWLHLPPQPSRKEVLRRLAELQRQGVDSYVIPDGELENGISLGMFSEQSRAQKLQEKIALLGYQPEILSIPREKRELWVFLPQGEAQKIAEERWLDLLSGRDLLQKQQNLCVDVASE